jgi:hypothetical protein
VFKSAINLKKRPLKKVAVDPELRELEKMVKSPPPITRQVQKSAVPSLTARPKTAAPT